jgi:NDP-sugar pyrophosphorylase family protein
MLTLVLPIAGNGKRFSQAGYTVPKPFIPVKGMTMIERCIENLPKADKVVLIHLQDHVSHAVTIHGVKRVSLPAVTRGEACTVLRSRDEVPKDSELIVADCDQWLDWSPDHFLSYVRSTKCDGAMTIFHGLRSHWSFVHLSPDMWVESVVEKVPVSDHAVAGVRYWRNAGKAFDAI